MNLISLAGKYKSINGKLQLLPDVYQWSDGTGRMLALEGHCFEGGWLRGKRQKKKSKTEGYVQVPVFTQSPPLASNWINRGVEGGRGQFPNKTAFDSFFECNVVTGLFGNTNLGLLLSTSCVQFSRVFLFGVYLPLLTQSSLFLFSLYQTTVLPLP